MNFSLSSPCILATIFGYKDEDERDILYKSRVCGSEEVVVKWCVRTLKIYIQITLHISFAFLIL